MINFISFRDPVDFGADGSSGYWSASKHAAKTKVVEDGMWFHFTTELAGGRTLLRRVPVTNVTYVGDDPPEAPKTKKAA